MAGHFAEKAAPRAVDAELARQVNRRFVTGVAVVATNVDNVPRGLAVNAFASLSLDPPMVIACVQKTSATYESLFQSTHMSVNILASDQAAVATVFASKRKDKFAMVRWRPGPENVPIIENCCAWMVVKIAERLLASTHTAFIGQITHADYSTRPPLIYSAGAFYDGAQLKPAIH